MTSLGLFAGFLVAAAVICVTPGPDMLYVASFGVTRGWRGGVAAAAGIAAGMSVHTVVAALGLSVVIAHSPVAFAVLKIVGAGYLGYLGVAMIRSSHDPMPTVDPAATPLSYLRVGVHATLVNVLNPKIIVFYIAFLPQFVRRPGNPVVVQMLVLGGLFVIMGFATDVTVGMLASRVAPGSQQFRRIGVVSGTVLCLLALALLAGL